MDMVQEELQSFRSLWQGGFRNEIVNSDKRNLGKVYEYCIKGNVGGKVVLEIGCGGGSWTKLMLSAQKIYALDALSEKHNRFWEYVGLENKPKIDYICVRDLSMREVPESSVDFVFSYDVFCHLSWSSTKEYMRNMLSRLKPGADCFIMVADFWKFVDSGSSPAHIKAPIYASLAQEIQDFDGPPFPGRWYWWGLDRFIELLQSLGYVILSKDINIDLRDPIVHFRSPGDLGAEP